MPTLCVQQIISVLSLRGITSNNNNLIYFKMIQHIHTHTYLWGGQRLRFGGKPLYSAMREMGWFSCRNGYIWCSVFAVFFSGHVHKVLSQWCYIVMPFQGLIPSERELEKDREIERVNKMDIHNKVWNKH